MKNNILSLVLIAILTGVLGVSCSKSLLDKDPLDKLSDPALWNDINLIQAYVNDQYHVLPSVDWYDKVRGLTLSSACDESIHQYGYNGIYDVNKGAMAASNPTDFETWKFDYGYIRSCNVFFSNISKTPKTNPGLIDRLKGEVYFIRAWCYLELAERYGGVPLITAPFQLDDKFEVPRSSYDSTVNYIVSQCDSAAALLPLQYSDDKDYGRASKGAAMTLKSRILLYAASPLWNASNDPAKAKKAADAAKAVIDLQLYPLHQGPMGSYNKIFIDNTNSEIIFQRTMDITSPNTVYAALEQIEGPNGGINSLGQYGGWNTNSPSQNLVDAFGMTDGLPISQSPLYNPQDPYTNRDPRFYADINYDEGVWHGVALEFFAGGRNSIQNTNNSDAQNCTRTGYTMRKHLNPAFDYQNDPLGQTFDPWIIFRISELYLNYAEAEYYAGDENQARWALNQLRSRPSVGLPDVTETGTNLLKRIQNERQVEMCFEGQRFFDVRRWKIAEVTENIPLNGINITVQGGVKTYTVQKVQDRVFTASKHYLFPIPQYELNKVKLTQNPGYN
ncbi:MAG TPA: RagB/SusD family nutrient uptake outer membrane protein [Puia sp.]